MVVGEKTVRHCPLLRPNIRERNTMPTIKYDFGSGRSDTETFHVAALKAAASKGIEEQAEA